MAYIEDKTLKEIKSSLNLQATIYEQSLKSEKMSFIQKQGVKIQLKKLRKLIKKIEGEE